VLEALEKLIHPLRENRAAIGPHQAGDGIVDQVDPSLVVDGNQSILELVQDDLLVLPQQFGLFEHRRQFAARFHEEVVVVGGKILEVAEIEVEGEEQFQERMDADDARPDIDEARHFLRTEVTHSRGDGHGDGAEIESCPFPVGHVLEVADPEIFERVDGFHGGGAGVIDQEHARGARQHEHLLEIVAGDDALGGNDGPDRIDFPRPRQQKGARAHHHIRFQGSDTALFEHLTVDSHLRPNDVVDDGAQEVVDIPVFGNNQKALLLLNHGILLQRRSCSFRIFPTRQSLSQSSR